MSEEEIKKETKQEYISQINRENMNKVGNKR